MAWTIRFLLLADLRAGLSMLDMRLLHVVDRRCVGIETLVYIKQYCAMTCLDDIAIAPSTGDGSVLSWKMKQKALT